MLKYPTILTALLILIQTLAMGETVMITDKMNKYELLNFNSAKDFERVRIVNDTVMGGVSDSQITSETKSTVLLLICMINGCLRLEKSSSRTASMTSAKKDFMSAVPSP